MRRLVFVFIFIIVIITATDTLVLEIGRAFVFVRLSVLLSLCQQTRHAVLGFSTHVLVPPQCFIDVARRELV
jgi:hypothetical protein